MNTVNSDGGYSVVITTCATKQDAEVLARELIKRQLAACIQMTEIRSMYMWEGAVAEEPETLLLIKSRAAQYSALEAAILELHTYDTPEVIQIPITSGSPAYLSWLTSVTGGVTAASV